jgi:hypothetical protein
MATRDENRHLDVKKEINYRMSDLIDRYWTHYVSRKASADREMSIVEGIRSELGRKFVRVSAVSPALAHYTAELLLNGLWKRPQLSQSLMLQCRGERAWKRKLGRNGLEVSAIGLGCMRSSAGHGPVAEATTRRGESLRSSESGR